MKIIYLGNTDPLLKEFISCRSDVVLVVAEPVDDKRKSFFGSSYDIARSHNIEVVPPSQYLKNFSCYPCDIIFSVGFSLLLRGDIFDFPTYGVINFHQSLLPKYRGRHPLNWAIINGEKETGITFHFMDERIDAGDIIYQERIPIDEYNNIMDLYHKTISSGRAALGKLLNSIDNKTTQKIRQNEKEMSYYPPRRPEDGLINLSDSARNIYNLVRALTYPYPGAFLFHEGRKWIIWDVSIEDENKYSGLDKAPGIISNNGHILLVPQSGLLKIVKYTVE
jgi:methionyl-tRNA formyltransferase